MKVKGMVEVARALIASAKSRWVLEMFDRFPNERLNQVGGRGGERKAGWRRNPRRVERGERGHLPSGNCQLHHIEKKLGLQSTRDLVLAAPSL